MNVSQRRMSLITSFVLVLCFIQCFLVDAVCNKPRIRRAWSELTLQEQQLYIRAITTAYKEGRFDRMSEVHWNNINFMYAHQTSGFFPWHRWYIFKMENYLRSLGPEFECITLTYWDWEYHNGDPTTAGHVLNSEYFGSITNIPGCVTDGFFAQWTPGGECVRRTWNRNYTIVGQKQMADLLIGYPFYGIDAHGFRSKFESAPHSNVHNWLGGAMGTSFSTYDPIFYHHHTNVDRIWSMWQDCHDYDRIPQEELGFDQYAGNDPDYNGIDVIIPYGSIYAPELLTPRIIHHIQGNKMIDMEYHYSRNRFPGIINQHHPDKPCNWDWFPVSQPTVLATNRRLVPAETPNSSAGGSIDIPPGCSKGYVYEVNALQAVEENELDGKLHTSSDLEFGYDPLYKTDQIVGVRFALNVPSGVTITNANVLFEVSEDSSNTVYMKIQIEDTSDSDSFFDSDISGRPINKKIQWTILHQWTAGSQVTTPDISNLIQSIVNRSDWTAGNAITLIFRGVQSNIPNARTVLSDVQTIQLTVNFCSTS